MEKKTEPAADSGIRMVGHRRISRTIHDHLIEKKVRKEMRSLDGRVTLRFEFAYLCDR